MDIMAEAGVTIILEQVEKVNEINEDVISRCVILSCLIIGTFVTQVVRCVLTSNVLIHKVSWLSLENWRNFQGKLLWIIWLLSTASMLLLTFRYFFKCYSRTRKFHVHQSQAQIEIHLTFTWCSPDVHLTTWQLSDLPLTLTRPLLAWIRRF